MQFNGKSRRFLGGWKLLRNDSLNLRQTGLYIFAAASILKDVANRVNEILEQGPKSQAPKA